MIERYIIPAALSILPERMDSHAARAMLVAIGVQESRYKHRRQVGGPARGFWQFEDAGVRGVLEHHNTATHARIVCERLLYTPSVRTVYDAIEDNDVLAACFARLLLWQHPMALPRPNETGRAWDYYLSQWRPGKPHRGTWDAAFSYGWRKVNDAD